MWVYWLFLSLFAVNAVIHIRPSLLSIKGRYLIRPSLLSIKGKYWSIEWVSIFILLVLFVGLRYQSGADWQIYTNNLEDFRLQGEVEITSSRDPGFNFLNWLAVRFDQELVLIYFISAIFFCYGLVSFCRNQALPSLSMFVAIPYIVIVVGMGYTRQCIALGFFMLGLVALENGNFWRYIKLIFFAALFHASALMLLPLAMVAIKRNLFIKILALALFIAFVYFFVLDHQAGGWLNYADSTYLTSDGGAYSSSGTNIRFAMVIFPALIFLLNMNRLKNNRMSNSIYVMRLWTVVALSSFVMIIPLIFLPINTAVDRMLIYWLPLQLFVFGNIPVAYLWNKSIYITLYFLIITYSVTVFFVWFYFGVVAHEWVPYSNYLWL